MLLQRCVDVGLGVDSYLDLDSSQAAGLAALSGGFEGVASRKRRRAGGGGGVGC